MAVEGRYVNTWIQYKNNTKAWCQWEIKHFVSGLWKFYTGIPHLINRNWNTLVCIGNDENLPQVFDVRHNRFLKVRQFTLNTFVSETICGSFQCIEKHLDITLTLDNTFLQKSCYWNEIIMSYQFLCAEHEYVIQVAKLALDFWAHRQNSPRHNSPVNIAHP